MKKKILLMGRSGCGKTSMRALIFSSALYPNPSSTRRLGTTLGVETSHFRFLKNLVISLFDMGGQQAYMDSYLDDRKGQLFKDVGAFVYVFDMGTAEQDDEGASAGWDGDLRYWRECLRLLHQNSPTAQTICLLHKMDLIDSSRRKEIYTDRVNQLHSKAAELDITQIRCCGTSIWDESLYRAWSSIIHSLIPNISTLEKNLAEFVHITGASEAVIFEKTTFLVIARSGTSQDDTTLHPDRFEKISELVKNLRGTCSKLVVVAGEGNNDDDHRGNGNNAGGDTAISSTTTIPTAQSTQDVASSIDDSSTGSSSGPSAALFQSFEIRGANFSAYLDWFTANTYILVIVADPRVSLEAVKMNVQLGRERFDKLG